jgi:UDP-N-acetylglucosamine--N-acetylmuramyl-(pentapeptide) pyrophosphoryl-undecaprenol N-acetylglucosamine transferase
LKKLAGATKKILITGGGSGGHLNTAFGVIAELKSKHPEIFSELVFVGGLRGMVGDSTPSLESRRVPEQGVRFIGIRSGKLQRYFSLSTLRLLAGVGLGFWDAWKVLRAEKPDLVFSTGGYVTVPVCLVAHWRGIPVIVHEQTIVSGLANRIVARVADKVLLTFPNSSSQFKTKGQIIVTGNTILKSRFEEIYPESLEPAYKGFLQGLGSGEKLIFITGGGLGSHTLNAWAQANLEKLTRLGKVLIQTGENQQYKDFEALTAAAAELPAELRSKLQVVKWYGPEVGVVLKHADIVICRPGANTVLELLATERKAVFVPIAWSSGNEQQLNAEYFCANQTGAIVAQKEINEQLLAKVEEVLQLQAKPSAQLVDRNAAEKIAKEILT